VHALAPKSRARHIVRARYYNRVMPSFSDPQAVCRPALPSDATAVLEFTKYIWQGHDYIQYVWQEWFDDSHGLLAVAQYGAQAVGMAKVSLVSSGQWWLEGLRVDPRYQGLKIGSHLHEYMHAWWLAHGDGTLRLMTSSERVQVHHLCDRTGFTKVREVFGYRFPPADAGRASEAGSHGFEPARLDQVPEAVAFAAVHPVHPSGLMDSGWRFSPPDPTLLGRHADAGRLHWWRGRMGLLASHEDEEDEGLVLAISLAATEEASLLPDLLRDAGRLALAQGFAYCHWLAPVDDSVKTALLAAGFQPDWDHAGFLYAKPHPGP
jgi:GNAT superfamily N-acetyltransferase